MGQDEKTCIVGLFLAHLHLDTPVNLETGEKGFLY